MCQRSVGRVFIERHAERFILIMVKTMLKIFSTTGSLSKLLLRKFPMKGRNVYGQFI